MSRLAELGVGSPPGAGKSTAAHPRPMARAPLPSPFPSLVPPLVLLSLLPSLASDSGQVFSLPLPLPSLPPSLPSLLPSLPSDAPEVSCLERSSRSDELSHPLAVRSQPFRVRLRAGREGRVRAG